MVLEVRGTLVRGGTEFLERESVGGRAVGRCELRVGDDERRERRLDRLALGDVTLDEPFGSDGARLLVDVERDDVREDGQVETPAGLRSGVARLPVCGLEAREDEVRRTEFLDGRAERDGRRPGVGGRHLAVGDEIEVVGIGRGHRLLQHLLIARRSHAHHAHRPAVSDSGLQRRVQRELVVRVHHGRRLSALQMAVFVERYLPLAEVGDSFRQHDCVHWLHPSWLVIVRIYNNSSPTTVRDSDSSPG